LFRQFDCCFIPDDWQGYFLGSLAASIAPFVVASGDANHIHFQFGKPKISVTGLAPNYLL